MSSPSGPIMDEGDSSSSSGLIPSAPLVIAREEVSRSITANDVLSKRYEILHVARTNTQPSQGKKT
jgi:hypothetical protein